MMKRTLFYALMVSFSLAASAQDISVYFEIIPEEQLIQIDHNRRKDMIDMKQAGRDAEFVNKLGGKSVMTDLTNDYLRIEVSDNSVFEMKMLNLADTVGGENQLISVIRTTCAPACDSDINFYTTTWQRLPSEKLFVKPLRKEFFEYLEADTTDVLSLPVIDLAKLSFRNGSDTIVASQSYEETLPVEVFSQISPFVRNEPLEYDWDGSRFIKRGSN